VSPAGLANGVGISEQGVGPFVDGSGQVFLGKSAADIGWETVVVVNAAVVNVKRKTFRGRFRAISRLESVGWVELLAKFNATAARGEEGSAAVLSERAKAEPTGVRAESGLGPLFVIWVQASELFETGPDFSIEGLEGVSMEAGGHNPHGVDHLAKAGAATKKLQGNLGVGHLTQSGEDPQSLGNTSLRVIVAEPRASHRSAEQLEVTVPDNLEIRRELGSIDSGGRARSEDNLAFVLAVSQAGAELQPYVSAAGLDSVDSIGDSCRVPRETQVVKVGVG